jgi:hypothetical protein
VRLRLSAGLLYPQFGHAFRAPAGPAGAQAGPSAPAGGAQPGQPGGVGQQFGDAATARDRDNGPDPPAGQGKPFPRPSVRRVSWHRTHDSILPYGSASAAGPLPLPRRGYEGGRAAEVVPGGSRRVTASAAIPIAAANAKATAMPR